MRCVVENCENNKRNGKRKPGVSFHYFPMNREMGIKWIKALGWRNRYISCHHRICSEHFEERFLDKSLGFKTRLTKNAVPTIFGQKVKQQEEVEEQIEEVVLEVPDEDVVIEYTEDQEEDFAETEVTTNYEEVYRQQCLLVEGLYQELQASENETNNLRDELQEMKRKYCKLQKLMRHLSPFEELLVQNEVHTNGLSEEICKFATNLYNISPLAYDFVQRSLLTALPDVETFVETEEV